MHSSRSQKPSNCTSPPFDMRRTSELSDAAAHVMALADRSEQISTIGRENIVDWSYLRGRSHAHVRISRLRTSVSWQSMPACRCARHGSREEGEMARCEDEVPSAVGV